ncbi:ATP-binding protein [Cysteiniphilum sp. 6C5]|uniref:ATP-binding protein n=1 Tax=unclassified Cysteiniphilum TaxID=2610889 RepID=UPI003F8603FD
MIKDPVYLASSEQIKKIFSVNNDTVAKGFKIGRLLKEEIDISLPWHNLFNTHIGVFGNTGSGKSNTLTKLYTELFNSVGPDNFKHKSEFLILDFNGEYTNNQILGSDKKEVIKLNTRKNNGEDKIILRESSVWNTEVLSLLFQATLNTQKPFINRVVLAREKYAHNSNISLLNYIKSIIKRIFTATSQNKDTRDLIIKVLSLINDTTADLKSKIQKMQWNAKYNTFMLDNDYFNGGEDSDSYHKHLKQLVENIELNGGIDFFTELQVRIYLQLINDLIYGYVQYDHIQPLLKRIESNAASLQKVIDINNDSYDGKLLSVISFRECNQDIKKILPLLIAKHFYEKHKEENSASPPTRTFHLIIDEAHNILSQQSSREHEIWRDYRLEVFEEIVKEGRKYGFFLTISSQRPADISATIMSQVHNFFIHRLINDRDLFLLDTTISTLDSFSKKMIPNLSKGACVVTGTSFDIPLLMQIGMLDIEKQPDSQDVDLKQLWKIDAEDVKENSITDS